MSNYHERYEAMKKGLGWKNKDVAKAVGVKLNSIENGTAKSKTDENFSKNAKGMIEVYETMIKSARIVFDSDLEDEK